MLHRRRRSIDYGLGLVSSPVPAPSISIPSPACVVPFSLMGPQPTAYGPAAGCDCLPGFYKTSGGTQTTCVNQGSDGPPCSAGFTVEPMTGLCKNSAGDTPYLAQQKVDNMLGLAMLGGAVASLFFLPGWGKLAALPLAYFGLPKAFEGFGL